jgi:hypothetical protein
MPTDLLPILRTSAPLPLLGSAWTYTRWTLGPSSIQGRVRCLTRDQSHVVSVLPDGTIILNPNTPAHDGGYEAALLDGNFLAYDYAEMTAAPVVFGIVRMGPAA